MTTTTTRGVSRAATRPASASAWSPYITDGWLPLFTIIMVCAAVIVAYGTHKFYSYILPDGLDWFATAVLTIGIPCLEFAATLAPTWRWRIFYLAGLFVLVGMESLAQYFQGQAYFVSEVRAQFPNPLGIDIATLAAEPGGRWLIVGYIAILSGIVIFFGFAASMRYKAVQRARGVVAERDEVLAALQREVAESRRLLAAKDEEVAGLVAQIETTQGSARGVVAKVEGVVADLQTKLAAKDAEVEQAKASARGLIAPTYPAFVEYLRVLAAQGKSPEVIAAAVQASPSTVRGWLNKK